jgi:Tfp pilus assembly major pilin PilA
MNDIKKPQRGMTTISLAVLVMVIVFFATLGIKLFPVYLEHFNVVQSLKSLKEEERTGLAVGEIISLLDKRFQINDVTSVKRENVKVARQGDKRSVTVAYEVRRPVIANIDLVVSFSDSIEM